MTYARLEDTFRRNPKIGRLARTLGIRRAEARGLLAGLWSEVLIQAPDGDLSSFEEIEIEEMADWEGAPGELFRALQNERHAFLERRRGRLIVHDWDEHAEGLKKRAWKRAERQKKSGVSLDREATGERQGLDSRARGDDLDLDLERRRSGSGEETSGSREEQRASAPDDDGAPLTLLPPENDPGAEVVLTFPATGKHTTWALTRAFLDELQQRHPHLDVLAVLRVAQAKASTGALRSVPTVKGYPRFVWSWLERESAPRGGPPARAAPGSRPGDPGNIDAITSWLTKQKEAR